MIPTMACWLAVVLLVIDPDAGQLAVWVALTLCVADYLRRARRSGERRMRRRAVVLVVGYVVALMIAVVSAL